jgi:hypothetical protein
MFGECVLAIGPDVTGQDGVDCYLIGPNWLAMVLVNPERPPRSVVDMVSSSIGCLATSEVRWIIRPQRRARDPRQDEAGHPDDIEQGRFGPEIHSRSLSSVKRLTGGPPVLVTRMSTSRMS